VWFSQKILQLLQNRKQVHQSVIRFVRYQTQARLIHLIMPHLAEEEKNIFRQGRNNKVVFLHKDAFTR